MIARLGFDLLRLKSWIPLIVIPSDTLLCTGSDSESSERRYDEESRSKADAGNGAVAKLMGVRFLVRSVGTLEKTII